MLYQGEATHSGPSPEAALLLEPVEPLHERLAQLGVVMVEVRGGGVRVPAVIRARACAVRCGRAPPTKERERERERETHQRV